MSDISLDNKLTLQWMQGIGTGWREASDWLMARAGSEFQAGKDDDAKALRKYADLMIKEAERKEHAVTLQRQAYVKLAEERDAADPTEEAQRG